MEFVLDTADIDEVKELDGLLTIAGVTTNPTIITKSGKQPEEVFAQLADYLKPEQKLFAQTISTDYDGMLAEARHICGLRPKNTYVKIPVTRTGLRVIKAAKAEGLGVLATAIYSADEAFLAALNGADYLAPYVNRMCSYGVGRVVAVAAHAGRAGHGHQGDGRVVQERRAGARAHRRRYPGRDGAAARGARHDRPSRHRDRRGRVYRELEERLRPHDAAGVAGRHGEAAAKVATPRVSAPGPSVPALVPRSLTSPRGA